ncbi:glycosyltransferase [Vicingus serpentipes]|uniref:Glycosyltransferase n=1 Tax=Vicingus serpentipes TaxID=1926625 RepID=A0A5C6RQN8_9FLAO|nr:glycosyltransferase [Vicingus serpentipes]TXB63702.1 glycosyltransferase [Vicingus serpentipes]
MKLQNNNNLLVSICCITYNHEKYIKQALDSFLMQKTDFAFEIVIHDDASTDSTQAIIKEYAKKHPSVFNPLYQKENQKSIYKSGMNPRFNYPRAKGKYIALCDGDDYWTDPLKLQKQVDLMELDDTISLVYTNCKEKYENTNLPLKTKYNKSMPEGYCFDEVIKGSFPQTVSIMYRKSFIPGKIADVVKPNYKMGDYQLALFLALKGKLKYLPDVTCVYRKNDTSISGVVAKNYLTNINFINSCREVLTDFTIENSISDPTLLQKIDAQLQHWLLTSFSMSLQNHNLTLAKQLWLTIKHNPTPIPIKYKILNLSAALGIFGKGLINFYYKK